MTFTKELVHKVANLSRLSFDDHEADLFSDQLTRILGYVEQLNQVDVSKVEPTSHVVKMPTPMREDKIRPSLTPEDALLNVAQSEAQCFRVPKVIQEQ